MSAYFKWGTSALAARSLFERGADNSTSDLINSTMSVLGTDLAPLLPDYLTSNPLPQGKPWGTRTASTTNYYVDTPNTGVTRSYNWTVTKQPCAPDGVANTCILINNQFPGPTIEANWGDMIEVTVYNNVSDEGTDFHWHGLLQKATPYMDGVPGMTQCPIAPYSTFTYRFQADLYGSSWYHSHYSAQYGSGLHGPIVIYGPQNAEYDEDLGPILVSDYYHEYYQAVIDSLFAPGINIPTSNNNLINGKNDFNCLTTLKSCTFGAPHATFNFTSGKTYRLRLINPSSAAVQKFTIDHHVMTVIANDFVEVQPYNTTLVTLAVGQRTDVLVKAVGSPSSSYYMRAYKPPGCAPSAGGDTVTATIFYENANRSLPPLSLPQTNALDGNCANDDLSKTVPFYAINPGKPNVTEVMPIEFKSNGTEMLWYLSNRTMRVDYNDPILLEAKLGNLNFSNILNVHNYGTNASVRFIIENSATGPGAQPHPIHFHGHNMFILAQGTCNTIGNASTTTGTNAGKVQGNCWDGNITNPSNPQRRDVQMLPPGSYIVVQWNQDNPGVWPLHCHIAWHLSAGFVWTVLENPAAITQNMNIPSIMAQTCRDWATWSGDNVVDQIDDGL